MLSGSEGGVVGSMSVIGGHGMPEGSKGGGDAAVNRSANSPLQDSEGPYVSPMLGICVVAAGLDRGLRRVRQTAARPVESRGSPGNV